MFTFQIKDTGTFAIGTAGASNSSNSSTSSNSKSSNAPQTGDAGVGTVAAGLTVAAAAAFITRRKNK